LRDCLANGCTAVERVLIKGVTGSRNARGDRRGDEWSTVSSTSLLADELDELDKLVDELEDLLDELVDELFDELFIDERDDDTDVDVDVSLDDDRKVIIKTFH